MRDVLSRAAVVIGLLGYLASGWLYLGAGLVVPVGAVPFLWAIWLAGVWVVGRLVRQRSPWTLATGPAAVLVWAGFVSLGEWLFGWTA